MNELETNRGLARRLGRQLLAAIAGAVICIPPYFLLGWMDDQSLLGPYICPHIMEGRTFRGTVLGAVTGAILGCGLLNGWIGSMGLWIVGTAVFFAFIGPGCDAERPFSALVGTATGMLFGLITWRGVLILFAAAFGAGAACSVWEDSNVAALVGTGLGAFAAGCLGFGVFPPKQRPGKAKLPASSDTCADILGSSSATHRGDGALPQPAARPVREAPQLNEDESC